MWKFFYLIIYQCNICRIYCDITPNTAHGNSDIRFLKCRCIVDSISYKHQFSIFCFFNPSR